MGPRFEVHEDAEWDAFLVKEDVHTWYGNLCKAANPRAFSRQDASSGASDGDVVHVKRSIHYLARRANMRLDAGQVPARTEMDALLVVLHEYSHCMVRLNADGSIVQADLAVYSHPDQAVPAILHALFVSRQGINAFTGVLRRNRAPAAVWLDGRTWYRSVLILRGEA